MVGTHRRAKPALPNSAGSLSVNVPARSGCYPVLLTKGGIESAWGYRPFDAETKYRGSCLRDRTVRILKKDRTSRGPREDRRNRRPAWETGRSLRINYIACMACCSVHRMSLIFKNASFALVGMEHERSTEKWPAGSVGVRIGFCIRDRGVTRGLESPAVIPDRLENGRRARRPWRAGSVHLKERVRHFGLRAKVKAFYKSMRAVQVAHNWKRRAYRAARFSARVGRRVYPAGHRT